MNKKLKYQLVQLGLGVILWGFVISYLANSPSERTAFLSGFKVLYQKAAIMVEKIFDSQRAYFMQERLNTITYLDKMLLIYKDYPCQDKVHQFKQILEDIQNNNLDRYITNRGEISFKIPMLEEQIKECAQ